MAPSKNAAANEAIKQYSRSKDFDQLIDIVVLHLSSTTNKKRRGEMFGNMVIALVDQVEMKGCLGSLTIRRLYPCLSRLVAILGNDMLISELLVHLEAAQEILDDDEDDLHIDLDDSESSASQDDDGDEEMTDDNSNNTSGGTSPAKSSPSKSVTLYAASTNIIKERVAAESHVKLHGDFPITADGWTARYVLDFLVDRRPSTTTQKGWLRFTRLLVLLLTSEGLASTTVLMDSVRRELTPVNNSFAANDDRLLICLGSGQFFSGETEAHLRELCVEFSANLSAALHATKSGVDELMRCMKVSTLHDRVYDMCSRDPHAMQQVQNFAASVRERYLGLKVKGVCINKDIMTIAVFNEYYQSYRNLPTGLARDNKVKMLTLAYTRQSVTGRNLRSLTSVFGFGCVPVLLANQWRTLMRDIPVVLMDEMAVQMDRHMGFLAHLYDDIEELFWRPLLRTGVPSAERFRFEAINHDAHAFDGSHLSSLLRMETRSVLNFMVHPDAHEAATSTAPPQTSDTPAGNASGPASTGDVNTNAPQTARAPRTHNGTSHAQFRSVNNIRITDDDA